MGVDEQHRRVLADDLELAVGLRLGAGEPVAVHVEAVQVAPLLELAAVRVLDRQDHDEGVVQDLPDHAVIAGGEVVQDAQGRIRAALLAAVDVAGHPQDRRGVVDRRLDARRRPRCGSRSVSISAWTAGEIAEFPLPCRRPRTGCPTRRRTLPRWPSRPGRSRHRRGRGRHSIARP